MKIYVRITNNFNTWPKQWQDFEVEAHYLSGDGNQTVVLLNNEKFQRFDENDRAGTEFLRSLESPARVALLGHGVLSRVKGRGRKIRKLAESITESVKTLQQDSEFYGGYNYWLEQTFLIFWIDPALRFNEKVIQQSIRQNPENYEVVCHFAKMLKLAAKIMPSNN